MLLSAVSVLVVAQSSSEIPEGLKNSTVVRYAKAQRIRLIGHIVRTDKEWMLKRITEWETAVVRNIGMPMLRREVDVEWMWGK